MKTVRNILSEKGHIVWSVASKTVVLDALKLMADKDIGSVLVIDAGQLRGIFTERDYARRVALKGKSSKDTPIAAVMTANVVCVNPQQTVAECMVIMSRRRLRHLPVMDRDGVIGVISIGDVVQTLLSEQEDALQRLEKMVSGTGLLD